MGKELLVALKLGDVSRSGEHKSQEVKRREEVGKEEDRKRKERGEMSGP